MYVGSPRRLCKKTIYITYIVCHYQNEGVLDTNPLDCSMPFILFALWFYCLFLSLHLRFCFTTSLLRLEYPFFVLRDTVLFINVTVPVTLSPFHLSIHIYHYFLRLANVRQRLPRARRIQTLPTGNNMADCVAEQHGHRSQRPVASSLCILSPAK